MISFSLGDALSFLSAASSWLRKMRSGVQYHATIKQLSDGNCLLKVNFSGFSYIEKITVNHGLMKECDSGWYADEKDGWSSSIDLGIQLGPNMSSMRLFLVKPYGDPKDAKFYVHPHDSFFAQRLMAQWEKPDEQKKSDMLEAAARDAEKEFADLLKD